MAAGLTGLNNECPVFKIAVVGFGHVAERHERLLNGFELDHQIPDCRVDPQSAEKSHWSG
jgi:hypothetical protein